MDQGDKSDTNDNEWSIRGPGKAPALLSGGDCSAVSQFIPGKDLQEVAYLFFYFLFFLSSFSHKVLFLPFSFSLFSLSDKVCNNLGKDLQEVADLFFYFVEMKLIFHKKTQLKRGLVRDGRPVFLFWKIEKKS